jgi:hypothetical protein
MGGGLTQLVLTGQMDSYININPCINYYKYVYNRHVNFSMENKRIDSEGETWNLNNTTNSTKKYIFRVRRLGDLISNMYLCFNLPDIYSTDEHRFRWINNIGHIIIISATIFGSGNVIIDRIYGDWMNIWNELTNKDGIEYNKLIGNIPELCGPTNNSTRYTIKSNVLFNKTYPTADKNKDRNNPSIRGRLLQVPLNFWFTRNPSLALPLYKLQQQYITVEVEFNNIEKLYQVWCDKLKLYVSPYFYKIIYGINNFNITNFINSESYLNCYLDITYIFLESEYRKTSLLNENIVKYVVEYVTRDVNQGKIAYNDSSVTSDVITANNHIKELIWIIRRQDIELNFNIYDNYTASHLYNENMGILQKAEITWADTIIRTDEEAYYYNNIQPYQYHTNVPRTGIYCYSFSLFPEKIMSAGSYNNQMINTTLKITIDNNYKTKNQFKYLFDLMKQKSVHYQQPESITFDLIIFSKATSVFSINSGSGNFIWI